MLIPGICSQPVTELRMVNGIQDLYSSARFWFRAIVRSTLRLSLCSVWLPPPLPFTDVILTSQSEVFCCLLSASFPFTSSQQHPFNTTQYISASISTTFGVESARKWKFENRIIPVSLARKSPIQEEEH